MANRLSFIQALDLWNRNIKMLSLFILHPYSSRLVIKKYADASVFIVLYVG